MSIKIDRKFQRKYDFNSFLKHSLLPWAICLLISLLPSISCFKLFPLTATVTLFHWIYLRNSLNSNHYTAMMAEPWQASDPHMHYHFEIYSRLFVNEPIDMTKNMRMSVPVPPPRQTMIYLLTEHMAKCVAFFHVDVYVPLIFGKASILFSVRSIVTR